jgi:hypothetical protein
MKTSKEHLEIALGGNMNTSSLTTLAIQEIMTDFAKQYHKEQLILSGVSYCGCDDVKDPIRDLSKTTHLVCNECKKPL